MNKTKLTLYVNKEISEKAKRISKITGKSISGLVSDFISRQDLEKQNFMVSEKVERWVGIAESSQSYKVLRDKIYEDKLKEYENSN